MTSGLLEACGLEWEIKNFLQDVIRVGHPFIVLATTGPYRRHYRVGMLEVSWEEGWMGLEFCWMINYRISFGWVIIEWEKRSRKDPVEVEKLIPWWERGLHLTQ